MLYLSKRFLHHDTEMIKGITENVQLLTVKFFVKLYQNYIYL